MAQSFVATTGRRIAERQIYRALLKRRKRGNLARRGTPDLHLEQDYPQIQ
jgi:hypothetical protein